MQLLNNYKKHRVYYHLAFWLSYVVFFAIIWIEEKFSEVGGIGLENIQKRLQLLFPQTHQLKILEEQGMYLVSLKVPLIIQN